MSNLQQKSIDGIIWNLIEKFGIQFVKLVLGVILARLLTPSDYGLIGMITVFLTVSNVFVDSGFGLAYIQKKNADETDASTIFFFNLAISIILYYVIWISSPLIAEFYDESILVNLTRAMGIILIINSFSIMQIAKLTKEVNFKKKTIILLVSSIISGTVGIIAALLNYGVWSLVIQSVLNALIRSLGLWLMYKWRPIFVFSFDSIKTLFSFSSWAFLTNIFSSIFDNIYILVIGKFFPASELGFYTKAKQFQNMVSKQTSMAVGSVAFPVFSQLQDEKIKLKNAMRKFNQHTLFFIAPLSIILLVIAKPFFLILLSDKWLPMVPYFQLLLIVGFLYPIHMTNVKVLSAQGKVKLTFMIEIIKNVFRVINIAIMYRYGVIFIIYGEILLSFIALIINTFYTKKFVNYGLMEQLRDVSSILLISIILVIFGMNMAVYINSDILKIFVTPIIIVSLYIVGMFYFDKTMLFDSINIIKKKFFR